MGGPGEVDAAAQVAAEQYFERQLARRGLHVKRILPDGNCLFRCVADRVYGDAEMHDVVRRLCLDHMEKERDHFSAYVNPSAPLGSSQNTTSRKWSMYGLITSMTCASFHPFSRTHASTESLVMGLPL